MKAFNEIGILLSRRWTDWVYEEEENNDSNKETSCCSLGTAERLLANEWKAPIETWFMGYDEDGEPNYVFPFYKINIANQLPGASMLGSSDIFWGPWSPYQYALIMPKSDTISEWLKFFVISNPKFPTVRERVPVELLPGLFEDPPNGCRTLSDRAGLFLRVNTEKDLDDLENIRSCLSSLGINIHEKEKPCRLPHCLLFFGFHFGLHLSTYRFTYVLITDNAIFYNDQLVDKSIDIRVNSLCLPLESIECFYLAQNLDLLQELQARLRSHPFYSLEPSLYVSQLFQDGPIINVYETKFLADVKNSYDLQCQIKEWMSEIDEPALEDYTFLDALSQESTFKHALKCRAKWHKLLIDDINLLKNLTERVMDLCRDFVNVKVTASNLALQRQIKRLTVFSTAIAFVALLIGILSAFVGFVPETTKKRVYESLYPVQLNVNAKTATKVQNPTKNLSPVPQRKTAEPAKTNHAKKKSGKLPPEPAGAADRKKRGG